MPTFSPCQFHYVQLTNHSGIN